jgi:hypothetical protein
MSEVRLAVAIPTYRRDQVLIDTLEQLFAQRPPADEILVIDQSESHPPPIRAALEQWHGEGRIRLIPHAPPNLPGARNRALRETRCDLVLFIDDDVRLAPGFIEAHRRHFAGESRVAAVAGRVSQPERTSPRWALFGKRGWRRELDFRYRDMDSDQPARESPASWGATTASASGSRGIWVDSTSGSSASGCARSPIWRCAFSPRGGLIVYAPEAHLIHLREPLGGCRPRDDCDTSGGESILHFAFKHRRTLGWFGFLGEVWLGLRIGLLHKRSLASPRRFLVRLGRLAVWGWRRLYDRG